MNPFRRFSCILFILLGIAILMCIGIASFWAARLSDRHLRQDLLHHTRMAALSIDLHDLTALSGTAQDMDIPAYRQIKRRLALIREAHPDCRFAYLMGRRPSGEIIFLADGEPDNSEDCSPPGQPYPEASEQFISMFTTAKETVEGPIKDRWGTWVSSAVRLPDVSFSGLPIILGMDVDAMRWGSNVISIAMIPAGLALVTGLLVLLVLWLLHSRRALRTRQDKLLQSEYRFRQIAEQSQTFIWEVDASGLYTFVSPVVQTLLGYSPEEVIGHLHFYDLHPENDRETFKRNTLKAMAGRKEFLQFENPAQTRDGKSIWLSTNGSPILAPDGTLLGYRGSDVDITERKQAEEKTRRLLEEARQARNALLSILEDQQRAEADAKRLATAIEQAEETIIITDASGLIEYVNPAFETVTGYSREEAVGRNSRFLKSGQQDTAFYHDLWETLVVGETWRGRFINRRKDGSFYTEEAVISPVLDDARHITHFVAVKRDITENLQLSEQIQQSQKMDSIGRLAGGIAHDFNNMLTVILGQAQMALDDEQIHAALHNRLIEIQKAASRSADLTQQLLAFARKQAVSPRRLELNQAVESTLKMLQRLIGEDIQLQWKPQSPSDAIEIDPVQLDQILANLCINARDAIHGGGIVTIETRTARIDSAYCINHPAARPGDYACLTVRDTGSGMDADTLSKIFEPFFTTKELGQGTGLGLSTVYGIIQQNSGFIEVESSPGKGSAFHVFLPRQAAEAESVPAEKPLPGGDETILVAEDEPAILTATVQMLESVGYSVLPAKTPDAALRIAQNNPDNIDLLLTDVVMPGMNGWMLSREILGKRPGIRCLFMSGYTADVIARNGMIDDGVEFIQKPFTRRSLAEKIRQVLDTPPS